MSLSAHFFLPSPPAPVSFAPTFSYIYTYTNAVIYLYIQHIDFPEFLRKYLQHSNPKLLPPPHTHVEATRMRPTKNQQSMFLRIVKAPVRALCRARDLYVRSMGSCASTVGYGNVGNPGGQHAPLPRSFSAVSARLDDSDDFRELLRAASMKSLGNDPLEALLKELKSAKPVSKMSKSCSVGMGRIDEEGACEFGQEGSREEVPKTAELNLYARRSRSYADAANRGKIGF